VPQASHSCEDGAAPRSNSIQSAFLTVWIRTDATLCKADAQRATIPPAHFAHPTVAYAWRRRPLLRPARHGDRLEAEPLARAGRPLSEQVPRVRGARGLRIGFFRGHR